MRVTEIARVEVADVLTHSGTIRAEVTLWAAQANQYGRWLAIALLAVFELTLLLPRFADRLMRPLVSAGNRLSTFALSDGRQVRAGSSLLLGIATGLLWAPCAGPILGLVLTGAALRGASVGTTLLLVAYAAGAATSLAVALLIGGRVFTAMKRSLGAGEWIRRGIGAAPGAAHGTDVAADGSGTVTEQRLYQLVRQTGDVADHTFSIEFLDPGVQAYAFTFG
jgi:hypothetical protein